MRAVLSRILAIAVLSVAARAAEIKFTSFQIDTVTTGSDMPSWLDDLRFSVEIEMGDFDCAAFMRGIITDSDVNGECAPIDGTDAGALSFTLRDFPRVTRYSFLRYLKSTDNIKLDLGYRSAAAGGPQTIPVLFPAERLVNIEENGDRTTYGLRDGESVTLQY